MKWILTPLFCFITIQAISQTTVFVVKESKGTTVYSESSIKSEKLIHLPKGATVLSFWYAENPNVQRAKWISVCTDEVEGFIEHSNIEKQQLIATMGHHTEAVFNTVPGQKHYALKHLTTNNSMNWVQMQFSLLEVDSFSHLKPAYQQMRLADEDLMVLTGFTPKADTVSGHYINKKFAIGQSLNLNFNPRRSNYDPNLGPIMHSSGSVLSFEGAYAVGPTGELPHLQNYQVKQYDLGKEGSKAHLIYSGTRIPKVVWVGYLDNDDLLDYWLLVEYEDGIFYRKSMVYLSSVFESQGFICPTAVESSEWD